MAKGQTQRCKCGFWRTNLRECRCSDGDVARYRSRISGPLLDRIDLYVDVPSIDVSELRATVGEETSATVRARVAAARRRRQLGAAMRLTTAAEALLARAARNMSLSAPGSLVASAWRGQSRVFAAATRPTTSTSPR